MHTAIPTMTAAPHAQLANAVEYASDVFQRSILFADTIRRRGNQYLDHLRQGQPPVLAFSYDILLDGRELTPPTNYYLARIRDRRSFSSASHHQSGTERRSTSQIAAPAVERRPVIIIDPRAGHGPGIGGAKRDSEIGMALDQGYPVYVILFRTWPVAGQTLDDVQQNMACFVETVRKCHPRAGKPAIIGNCQAGWAAALLGAVRPDITGPIVMNGAPLSYWAGIRGEHPMRYKGGLSGGAWLASLWGDLGNGMFDGAHLVAGFEDLNPANTLWDKQYHLWANVDTEEDRYLEFERWWNGFFMLTAEEIHTIVYQLFMGNHAQQGRLVMNGRQVDLKALNGPIVVFASHGDNITPPQQALNWIPAQWASADDIRRRQLTIVYMLHGTIGHLGIFVSGAVSRKEHREIMASIDLIDYLSPGLYEMVISQEDSEGLRQVRFESREMADILALDDGSEDEAAFVPAATLSRLNDSLYRWLVRPWIKAWVTEASAEALRQLHPLRMTRYGFSDLNPWMGSIKQLAATIKAQRLPVTPDNPFLAGQHQISQAVSRGLNLFRDLRDWTIESCFYWVFDNYWIRVLSHEPLSEDPSNVDDCGSNYRKQINSGGFAEAVVRIMAALTRASAGTQRRSLEAYSALVDQDDRLMGLHGTVLSEMVKQQSCILESAPEAALAGLVRLLPDPTDRRTALAIASAVLADEVAVDGQVKRMHAAIAAILGE